MTDNVMFDYGGKMITEETYDMIDDIYSAFGTPRRGNNDAGMTDADGNIYNYICVVRGDDEVFYDGFDEWSEAYDKCDTTAYESIIDWEYEGVWMVVAVIETKTGGIMYPSYKATLPESCNGALANHL